MRRLLLGLALLLPGCSIVGSPFDGFGKFIGDTHTPYRGQNQPAGGSINMLRVKGEAAPAEPLLPEPGNVWPGPPPPEPTLQDIERQEGLQNPVPPGTEFPRLPPPRGSGSPPPPIGIPPASLPQGTSPPALQGPGASIPQPAPSVVQTDRGPATIRTDANGIQSFTMPDGSTGHVVNNGNGTMTLIGNDGRVTSAPAPR